MRKLLKKLVATVVCLLLISTVLIACVKEPEPTPSPAPEPPLSAGELLTEAVEKIQSSSQVDGSKAFGIDILSTIISDDKVDKDKSFTYQILLKANLDLSANAKDENNNFRFEISRIIDDEIINIFSILYESDVDTNGNTIGSYFYLTISEAETLKITAHSLVEILGYFDINLAQAVPDDTVNLILTFLSLYLDSGTTQDGNYTFTVDVTKTWQSISDLLLGFLTNPDSLSEIIPGVDINSILTEVDKVIANIFGDLQFIETDADDNNSISYVESLVDLIIYTRQSLPQVKATLNINFNKNIFSNASLKLDINSLSKPNDIASIFTIELNKAIISNNSAVVVDENYLLTKEERDAIDNVIGLINFNITGTVGVGTIDNDGYIWSLNADINPFVLMKLTNGVDNANLIDTIKNLGYLSLRVDRPEDNKNILTLHSDFASGKAFISFATPGKAQSIVTDGLQIGGVFEFEPLIELISLIGGGEVAGSAFADETVDPITALLNKLLGSIKADNLTEEGVAIIGFRDIVKDILILAEIPDMMGLHNTVSYLFTDWAGEDLFIKVDANGVKYGACEKNDLDSLDLESMYYPEYVNDMAGIPLSGVSPMNENTIKKAYEYGEAFQIETFMTEGKYVANSFLIQGKNYLNKTVTDVKAVFYASTYDPYKIGEQTVQVYYGLNSRLAKLLAGGMVGNIASASLNPMWPIYGVQMFEVVVEVHEEIIDNSPFIKVTGTTNLGVGENIAEALNAYIKYQDKNGKVRQEKVTTDMISCINPIIDANGKVTDSGTWKLDIKYYGASASVYITVGELLTEIDTNTHDLKHGTDLQTLLNPIIRTIDSNGFYQFEKVTINPTRFYQVNPRTGVLTEKPISDVFELNEDGSYNTVLLANITYLGTNPYAIEVEYEMFGMTKSILLQFNKIILNESNDTLVKHSRLFQETSRMDNPHITLFSVYLSNDLAKAKPYKVVYNFESEKWEAVYTSIDGVKEVYNGEAEFKFYYKDDAGNLIPTEIFGENNKLISMNTKPYFFDFKIGNLYSTGQQFTVQLTHPIKTISKANRQLNQMLDVVLDITGMDGFPTVGSVGNAFGTSTSLRYDKITKEWQITYAYKGEDNKQVYLEVPQEILQYEIIYEFANNQGVYERANLIDLIDEANGKFKNEFAIRATINYTFRGESGSVCAELPKNV